MAIKARNSVTVADVSDGIDGTGISSTTVEYQAGSSGTSKPTGTWSTTIPATSSSAPYLWTRVTYRYSDGRSPLEVFSVGATPESVEIGGRNVIRNSAFINGLEYWSRYGNTSSVDTDRTFNGHPTIKVCNTGLTENRWYGPRNYYLPQKPTSILAGETWTVSCYYYVEDASTIDDYFCLEVKGRKEGATSDSLIGGATRLKSSTTVEGAWTKIKKTFTATKDYSNCLVFAFTSKNGTVWFADFKLEKGNKATDWTPAPEDAEDAISNLEDWKTEASQKITKDGIIATVGNYYTYQTDMDSVENRVAKAETKIIQHADEIELRVEKAGIISAINQTAETVKISAARITLAGATIADSFTATNLHVTGNSVFDGTLRATKGTIAGWDINSTSISTTNSSGNYIYFGNASSANQDVLFVRTGAGTTASPYSYPVIIRGYGYAEFRNAKIIGDITATSITARNSYSIHDSNGNKARVLYSGDGSIGNTLLVGDGFSSLHLGGLLVNRNAGQVLCGEDGSWDLQAGIITSTEGFVGTGLASGGQFRAVYGNYGFILRNDGSATYFLLTNSGDPYGSWNNFRPLIINNSSGFVSMSNGLQVGGALTCLPYENTSYKRPICSTTTDGQRVTYAATNVSSGTYYIRIYGQYGTTGTTYAGYVYNSKTSDIRLKHNIRDTDVKALPVINKMRMRAFDWADGTHQDIGYVADELELIDSSFAIGGGYDDDGVITYKSVNDLYVLGYLTKGIQELYSMTVEHNDRILTVEARLDEQMLINEQLMDENAKLKKRVAQLEEQNSTT